MVNTCALVYCKTGYKKSENQIDVIPEKYSLFGFPENNPDLFKQWVAFVNQKLWKPSNNSAICAKHFDEKYLKIGKIVTLVWNLNPFPTIYCLAEKIPPSVYSTTSKTRKPPSVRHPLNNQDNSSIFIEKDEIHCLNDLNNFSLEGYQLKIMGNTYFFS
ncbi:uncharacterized protein LOC136095597 [Hydra vulgaris]|uniref:uncharacterized protein LOC136095597 n=1 Tax=Hydra vulgaris TaxID=6087 RepID=UPI0032E9D25D